MKQLTIKQVKEGVKGILLIGNEDVFITDVCTDSQEAETGHLFIPIIGDVHDAHDFIPQCLEKGCRSFLISNEAVLGTLEAYEDVNVVLVKDTTTALQDLAAYYLDLLNIKKIAVTGSTGKTSTRDFIYSVCSKKYNCKKNKGNLNNLIGVPLTIFTFEEDTEVAVIEMGMDRFGEIERLAEIVRPDIGVITNIGTAHIEHLGSREGIFKAKMELTRLFTESNTLIVSTDPEFLRQGRLKGNYRLVSTGACSGDEFVISSVDDLGIDGIEFTLAYDGEETPVRLLIPGAHNALNGAIAIAVGVQLGISVKEAAESLANARLTGKRLTVKEGKGIKIIDDTYNAGPASVMGAIDALIHSACRRKVAILGDMYELGDESQRAHRRVGKYASEQGADLIIAIGQDARYTAEGAKKALKGQVLYYETKETFIEGWRDILQEGDLILVKGSRGMEMEKIVEAIVV